MASRKNRRAPSPPLRHPVEVQIDGETHSGVYSVEKGFISVSYALGGRKGTQVGSSDPVMLARMLLLELVGERRSQGSPT